MHLSRIQVWNFRSYWTDESDPEEPPSLDLTFSPGVNYLSGPNNAGKSNLLRALAYALDPEAPFDIEIDRARGKKVGPEIVLELHAGQNPNASVRKLLEDCDQLERAIEEFQEPSLASQGIVRFYVKQWDTSREERFLTRDSWESPKSGKAGKIRQRAAQRLRELVQYVDIKSGEDLQSLLQRGFKDVLASAVLDEHAGAMKSAEAAREAYRYALGQMLRPIARHVQDRIRPYVRDVEEIDLVAQVPSVEDALAAARVVVKDAFETALEHKGTGVRGAMLLLLLSFIADSARTPVIFGIEEPEAFLHPDAHRALGEGLSRFTRREDITLLVTTHSPFLYRADGDPRNAVFRVTKDAEGRSSVSKAKAEEARTDLLGSEVLSGLLEKIESVPSSARMVLLVEGKMDLDYLTLAAKALHIPLAGIHIVMGGSAAGAVLQAVTLAARHSPARKIVALFDSDGPGNEAFEMLNKRFSWGKRAAEGLFVLRYSNWIPSSEVAVEAEDVFGSATMETFLALPGHADFCDQKIRRKNGLWHHGLTSGGKSAFVKWLEQHGTSETFEPWRPVLEHLVALGKEAGKR